jgi:hypothetical protein
MSAAIGSAILVFVSRIVGEQHLFDTREFGGGVGNRFRAFAGNEDIDVAANLPRRQSAAFEGRRASGWLVVVFGNEE